MNEIRLAIEGAKSNRERIARATGAYFSFIDANEGSFRLLFRETMGADPDFRSSIERFRDEPRSRIAAVIQAEAGLPTSEAELLARGVMGIAESSAQWWLEHEPFHASAWSPTCRSRLARVGRTAPSRRR